MTEREGERQSQRHRKQSRELFVRSSLICHNIETTREDMINKHFKQNGSFVDLNGVNINCLSGLNVNVDINKPNHRLLNKIVRLLPFIDHYFSSVSVIEYCCDYDNKSLRFENKSNLKNFV